MTRYAPKAPHQTVTAKLSACAVILALSLGTMAVPAFADDKVPEPARDATTRVVSDAPAPESTERPERPERPEERTAPRARESNVVRMVIDRSVDHGDETTEICVFVPAGDGDETTGVLSCSGDEVHVVEFGPEHGSNVMFGNTVLDEDDLRDRIQERMEVLVERLSERENWEIEFTGRFEYAEELHEEMAELQEEMSAVEGQISNLDAEYTYAMVDIEELSQAELRGMEAEFQMEMAEFQREMHELAAEMAELQAEAFVGVAEEDSDFSTLGEELARLGEAFAEVGTRAALEGLEALENMQFSGRNRLHIVDDEYVAIVERAKGEDGTPRIVIRTTDPSSIELVHMDEDEAEDHRSGEMRRGPKN